MTELREIEIEGVKFIDAKTDDEVEEALHQGRLVLGSPKLFEEMGIMDEVDSIEVD